MILDHVEQPRPFSQTCQRLQELALPRLWSDIDGGSVRNLALLRELLAASPLRRNSVKLFQFNWSGYLWQEELRQYWHYPEECSPLELAFCDRLQYWDDVRQRAGAQLLFQRRRVNLGTYEAYFVHNGVTCIAPGYFTERVTGDGHALRHNHRG